jgi:hypothetical protein
MLNEDELRDALLVFANIHCRCACPAYDHVPALYLRTGRPTPADVTCAALGLSQQPCCAVHTSHAQHYTHNCYSAGY